MNIYKFIKVYKVAEGAFNLAESSSHNVATSNVPRHFIVVELVKILYLFLQTLYVMRLPKKSDFFIYAASKYKTQIEVDNILTLCADAVVLYDQNQVGGFNVKKIVRILSLSESLALLLSYFKWQKTIARRESELYRSAIILKYAFYYMAFKKFFNERERVRVVNLFSSTAIGFLINKASIGKGNVVGSYIWGSNVKSKEQLFTKHDLIFAKYDYELDAYPIGCYKKAYVVGNAGINPIYKDEVANEIFDFCIFDTCTSAGFDEDSKMALYRLLRDAILLSNTKISRIAIKLHPATKHNCTKEILQIFSMYDITVYGNNVNLVDLIKMSRACLSINSTIIFQLQASDIPSISLMPYFLKQYRKDLGDVDRENFVLAGLFNVEDINILPSVIKYCYDSDGTIATSTTGINSAKILLEHMGVL